MAGNIRNIMAAIEYMESRLDEKLDLETVAEAVHYSKYHLHRMFTDITGLTVHGYVQRRRLTEAARRLVCSDRPILELALLAGYESQQSFTDAFKAMYKKTPNQYREEEEFYPLQLKYVLCEKAGEPEERDWRKEIVSAGYEDIREWIGLVRLVIDGFPHLDEEQYQERLRKYIDSGRALILKESGMAIGVMAFHEIRGSIDFLGVHPQYRKLGIAKAFCAKALYELSRSGAVTVTTFREGDRADTGYRETYKNIGFGEAELLIEYGYPTQRLILRKEDLEDNGHE